MTDADDALDAYPTPAGLGAAGRPMWEHMTTIYTWRWDELLLLERAARLADTVARREAEVAALDSFESVDHRGAPADHPVAAGLARDINALRLLVASLGLGGATATSTRTGSPARSTAARSAANARWRGSA